jgi:hypothetical protein
MSQISRSRVWLSSVVCRSPPFLVGIPLYRRGYMFKPTLARLHGETRWLELLRPLTSARNLYLSKDFARHIAPALDELGGEIMTEVLPTENVFIEEFQPSGSVHEAIG